MDICVVNLKGAPKCDSDSVTKLAIVAELKDWSMTVPKVSQFASLATGSDRRMVSAAMTLEKKAAKMVVRSRRM